MIAWKMLIDMIPPEDIKKKNESYLSIEFTNGSAIELRGCDTEDSLRGVGVSFCVLDEYASMKPNVWEEVIRPMLADSKGRALFIGTPKGKNHFWELYMKGQKGEGDFKSWRYRTVDNPFIDPEEVKQAGMQMAERYFKQEFNASFEDYTGLIWPEFSQKHAITPLFEIPKHWQKVGAIDTALSGITGVLWGRIDDHGNLFITNEYYGQNKRVSEVCADLKGIDKGDQWYIDPASKGQKVEKLGKLYSLYDEYIDNGIRALPGENDVSGGINRVGEYFKKGKIKVYNTCKNLIRELERYHWGEERDTVHGVLTPKPYKSDDHLCDCLRYMVMSRFSKSDKRDFVPDKKRNTVWLELQRGKRTQSWKEQFV